MTGVEFGVDGVAPALEFNPVLWLDAGKVTLRLNALYAVEFAGRFVSHIGYKLSHASPLSSRVFEAAHGAHKQIGVFVLETRKLRRGVGQLD